MHVNELRAELVLRPGGPEAQQEGVQACRVLPESRGLRVVEGYPCLIVSEIGGKSFPRIITSLMTKQILTASQFTGEYLYSGSPPIV